MLLDKRAIVVKSHTAISGSSPLRSTGSNLFRLCAVNTCRVKILAARRPRPSVLIPPLIQWDYHGNLAWPTKLLIKINVSFLGSCVLSVTNADEFFSLFLHFQPFIIQPWYLLHYEYLIIILKLVVDRDFISWQSAAKNNLIRPVHAHSRL